MVTLPLTKILSQLSVQRVIIGTDSHASSVPLPCPGETSVDLGNWASALKPPSSDQGIKAIDRVWIGMGALGVNSCERFDLRG